MRFDIMTLELDKIIRKITQFADSNQGKASVKKVTPSFEKATVLHMLEETYEASLYVSEGMAPSFGGVYDITEALSMAKIYRTLTVRDFLDIASFIEATKRIKREMQRLSAHLERDITLERYAQELTVCSTLHHHIMSTMNEQGDILSSASLALKSLRHDLDVTEKRIRQTLDQLLQKESKRLTESLITMRQERYVIPVKLSEKNNVRGNIIDYSSSGETAYIEPHAVSELTGRKIRLEADIRREIEKLLYQLTMQVNADYESLHQAQNSLAHLDMVFAKAKYGISIDGTKVTFNQRIHLINARHPLIPSDEVVANTITFDEGVKTMVITGSNTGGKTVTLKTVGLLALMAQSGCLIPASTGSSLPVLSQIRADIGDEQSIEQSLSTFSSHMKKIVDIINTISEQSLILLDELGSGTDPKEGASLAMSILEYLDQHNVFVMATTHYPELKAYGYMKNSIVNASVAFDEQSLKPTYRLLLRTPGESHAFLIAKRLGLNNDIIEDAKQRTLTQRSEVGDLIQKLKTESKRLDNMINEYDKHLSTQKTLNAETSTLKKTLQHEKETLKEKLTLENKIVIDKLKKEALSLIHELENMKEGTFKTHDLAKLKYDVRTLGVASDKTSDTLNHPYKPGDKVYLLKYNRYGELIKQQKNGKWLVKMGALKSTFDPLDFEYAADKAQAPDKKKVSEQPLAKAIPAELDLRGERVLEAQEMIEKYLDDALVANVPFVSIIHGFGTLALRKMVHKILKDHPQVASFRDGKANEGGQGVSVVYFKE